MTYTAGVELVMIAAIVAFVAIDAFVRRERKPPRDEAAITTKKIIVDLRNRR